MKLRLNLDRASAAFGLALGSMWGPGVTAIILITFLRGVGIKGENDEWALYLCLGILAPIITLGLFSVDHWAGGGCFSRWYRPILGVVAVTGVALVCRRCGSRETLVWALTLALLSTAIHFFSRTSQSVWLRVQEMIAVFPVALISWLGALYCLYWTTPTRWLLTPTYPLMVFLGAMFVVGWTLFRESQKPLFHLGEHPAVRRVGGICGHTLALALFGVLSFRVDGLFSPDAVHHWSFWVGPIESVREGGWLLWDVPSQYGFLSILLLALMPIKSAWESLFLVQGALIWIVAALLYFRLRLKSQGLLNYAASCLIALTSVYFMNGFCESLNGPQEFVSVGPMRFFWCYMSMFVLWVCLDRDPPRLRLYRWLGGAVCLAGALWSVESAIYSIAIYGLSCAVLALQAAAASWHAASYSYRLEAPLYEFRLIGTTIHGLSHSLASAMRVVGAHCLVPFVMLSIGLAGIEIFYLVRLGHPPDWRVFWEYATVYTEGFGALPIEVNGPVWVLVALLCSTLAVALAFLETEPFHRGLSLTAGAYGAIWTTASYYVSRSHPNNVCNLMPVLVMALALLLPVAQRLKGGLWSSLLKHAAMPVFVIGIVATCGNPLFPSRFPGSRQAWRNVAEQLPVIESTARALLEQHKAGVSDPFVCNYEQRSLPPIWSPASSTRSATINSRSWLPKPVLMLAILPPERRAVYIQRYCERARQSGWFLQYRQSGVDAWLLSQIKLTHRATMVGQDQQYCLYWCDYEGTSAITRERR